MKLILIAIIGAVLDIVWTLMIQAITGRRPLRAAVLQGIFTALVVGATWSIVKAESVPALVAYSIGSAIGTWFVVRYCNVQAPVRADRPAGRADLVGDRAARLPVGAGGRYPDEVRDLQDRVAEAAPGARDQDVA